MLDRPVEHVGDRLDPAVRVPRETRPGRPPDRRCGSRRAAGTDRSRPGSPKPKTRCRCTPAPSMVGSARLCGRDGTEGHGAISTTCAIAAYRDARRAATSAPRHQSVSGRAANEDRRRRNRPGRQRRRLRAGARAAPPPRSCWSTTTRRSPAPRPRTSPTPCPSPRPPASPPATTATSPAPASSSSPPACRRRRARPASPSSAATPRSSAT